MEAELARLEAGGVVGGVSAGKGAASPTRSPRRRSWQREASRSAGSEPGSSGEIEEESLALEPGSPGSPTAEETAALAREAEDRDADGRLSAHEARVAKLEELVERKRLEALAVKALKSRERELVREMRQLDASIERARDDVDAAESAESAGGWTFARARTVARAIFPRLRG